MDYQDDIVRLYTQTDMPVREIARAVGVSPTTVNHVIKTRGVTPRNSKLMDGMIEAICEMRRQGRSNTHIVNVTGLSKQRVSQLIRDNCPRDRR